MSGGGAGTKSAKQSGVSGLKALHRALGAEGLGLRGLFGFKATPGRAGFGLLGFDLLHLGFRL